MATQIHPRLRELEEEANRAAATETEPSTTDATVLAPEAAEPAPELSVAAEPAQVEASESPALVTTPEPEPEATPEPVFDGYIKLDPRQSLYQQMRQLEQSNDAVRQVLSEYAGRSAKKKFEPQIRALEAKLAEANATVTRLQVAQVEDDPDALAEKLRTDAEFARRYHESRLPKAASNDGAAIEQWAETFEDVFDQVLVAGLPSQRVQDYRQALSNGFFGDLERQTPAVFAKFQNTVLRELQLAQAQQAQQAAARQPAPVARPAPVVAAAPAAPVAPPPPKAAVAPKVNPALSEAQPDLSTGSHGGNSAGRVSAEELRQMTPPERMARWPTAADFERDVRAGLVG